MFGGGKLHVRRSNKSCCFENGLNSHIKEGIQFCFLVGSKQIKLLRNAEPQVEFSNGAIQIAIRIALHSGIKFQPNAVNRIDLSAQGHQQVIGFLELKIAVLQFGKAFYPVGSNVHSRIQESIEIGFLVEPVLIGFDISAKQQLAGIFLRIDMPNHRFRPSF